MKKYFLNRKFILILFFLLPFAVFAQMGSVKQVENKSLENQIRSTVGVDGHWDFSPGWWYSIFHSKYKSGDYEINNKIYLDSIVNETRLSMVKIRLTRDEIQKVYQNELAHYNDRNIDNELNDIKSQLDEARKAIGNIFAGFSENSVSLDNANLLYKELERIDEKVKVLNKAHLDNSKRRQGYEKCLTEYNALLNVSYKVLYMSYVASKYDIILSNNSQNTN